MICLKSEASSILVQDFTISAVVWTENDDGIENRTFPKPFQGQDRSRTHKARPRGKVWCDIYVLKLKSFPERQQIIIFLKKP